MTFVIKQKQQNKVYFKDATLVKILFSFTSNTGKPMKRKTCS